MQKKILLIEDEPFQIEIYEKAIKEAGFEIETLKSGKEGLKALEEIKTQKKEKPDLILLDLVLPDIDGIIILKKAKSDPQLKDIPFFILTNYPALELEIIRKEDVVAEKYLVKADLTPSQLIEIIKEWFKEE
ncbi:MAG: response regulator [Patescibacteria group bacterium]|nr:response regulator [Patescibacteria group bacterium]